MTWSGQPYKIEAFMSMGLLENLEKRSKDPDIIIRGVAEQTRPGGAEYTFPVVTVSERNGVDGGSTFRTLRTDDNSNLIIVSVPEEEEPYKTLKTEGVVLPSGFSIPNLPEVVGVVRVLGKNVPQTPVDPMLATPAERHRLGVATKVFGPESKEEYPLELVGEKGGLTPLPGKTGGYWFDGGVKDGVGYRPLAMRPGNLTNCVSQGRVSLEGIRVAVGELAIPGSTETSKEVGKINDGSGARGVFKWLNGDLTMKRFIPGADGGPETTLTLHCRQDQNPPTIACSVVQSRIRDADTDNIREKTDSAGIGVQMSPDGLHNVTVAWSRETPLDLQAPLPSPEEHRFLVEQTTRQTQVIPVLPYGETSVSPKYVVGRNARSQVKMDAPVSEITITPGKVDMGDVHLDLPTGVFNIPGHGINIEPALNGSGFVVTERGVPVMSLAVEST